MKHFKTLFVLIVFLTISCQNTPKKETKSTSEALQEVLENYYQESLKLYPLSATYQGDYRYNDLLPNSLTDEFKEREKSFYRFYLNEADRFEDTTLSKEDVLSKKVLKWECETNLDRLTFEQELTPINQMWTLQLTMGQLAGGTSAQPFETVTDYENWLERVDAYLEWMQTAEERMREGINKGVVLPTSLIKKVIPQLNSLTHSELDTHLFYSPIKNLPDTFSDQEKERLTDAYAAMVTEKIIPAYKKLAAFMETEYLKNGRETSGIGAYDFGDRYYDYSIKLYTTTSMTAEEIHELGLKEVARISQEMEAVKQQVGFEGDLSAFFDHVRNLDELTPFTDPQEVIDNFNAIHQKMKSRVDALFELQPKTAFEVRRTEAFREASASAEYSPGSLDGTRPGIFYVPIPDVKKYNVFADEDLFLHEAIPGHHFQISLQQENTALPSFRKSLWYSSYGEGWALYCESLGKELGLYDNPYQYFGMLSAEMHRAIRLVVDTGIHTKGWSREKAIQYSLDNEAESEASIISEIERYMANPGQALSYKIGQLTILKLRKKAEEILGDRFDIREFHAIVLESGCIPLQLMEDKINDWIYKTKTPAGIL